MTPDLSVDAVMDEVRTHVRERLRAELARADPSSPLRDHELFEQAEAIYRAALARRKVLVMPSLLLDETEWGPATSLRFTSHRPLAGRLILFVKRRLVLPLTRWLYEFSRDNFEIQTRVNDTLMATIETLVAEMLLLRREVEELRARQAPSSGRTPEGP